MRATYLLPTFVLLAVASDGALGAPFELRRQSDQPALVRTAPVHAVATSAPFDDEAGSLTDGQTRFYVVVDVAGSPLQISVNKNDVSQAVRLGFDDGDPTSAAVDIARSTLSVAPATIAADGVSTATVTIVPRDADGVALGAGLDVAIDVGALWPGTPRGAVVDHGNGSYTLTVVSWTEGFGLALATVEGRVLTDAPEIAYTYAAVAGPPADLLGIVDEIQAIVDGDPNSAFAKHAEKAIDDLLEAVAELGEVPLARSAAIHDIHTAFKDLGNAEKEGFDPLATDGYRERLADIARQLAVEAIDTALAGAGDPTLIDNAWNKLADGDDEYVAGKFDKAVKKYQEAAREAQDSL